MLCRKLYIRRWWSTLFLLENSFNFDNGWHMIHNELILNHDDDDDIADIYVFDEITHIFGTAS